MSNHYSPTADNQSRARQQAIPTAHYIGLDLGQTRDPSALAVMERSEISMGVSPVTFERLVQPRYSFRHLERMPLGLDYTSQVEQVRTLVKRPEFSRSATLIVDATGVGPLSWIFCAAPPCLAAGDKETCESGIWHVPKRDLMTGLLVLFQRGEIKICRHLLESETLAAELANMRIKVSLSGQDTDATWREASMMTWFWPRPWPVGTQPDPRTRW